MKDIAFRNGTIVLSIPDRFIADLVVIDMRVHIQEWALLATTHNEAIYGHGTIIDDEGKIKVTGRWVNALPDWWQHGRPIGWKSNLQIAPNDRTIIVLSDTVIPIGKD